MRLFFWLSACSGHSQHSADVKDCFLVKGDLASAVVHMPSGSELSDVDRQFGNGRFAGRPLCERVLTAEDLRLYGWVIEVPGRGLAWTSDTFANEAEFRRSAKRCDVHWHGQVNFLGDQMIVHVEDPRFMHRGTSSCNVGQPASFEPGLL